MTVLIRIIVAVGTFLYGYVVGDDLLLAVVIVLGLATTGLLVAGASTDGGWCRCSPS